MLRKVIHLIKFGIVCAPVRAHTHARTHTRPGSTLLSQSVNHFYECSVRHKVMHDEWALSVSLRIPRMEVLAASLMKQSQYLGTESRSTRRPSARSRYMDQWRTFKFNTNKKQTIKTCLDTEKKAKLTNIKSRGYFSWLLFILFFYIHKMFPF